MLHHLGSLLMAAASFLFVDDAAPTPPPPPPAPDQPAIYMPTSPIIQLGGAAAAICTGFFVGTPDIVVSAGHCGFGTKIAADKYMVLPVGADPETDMLSAIFVGGGDPAGGLDDYSIFRLQHHEIVKTDNGLKQIVVEDDIDHDWKPVTLDCHYTPAVGDEVTSMGYPAVNTGETLMKGFINGAVRTFPPTWNVPLIPLTMAVSPGASGSPVFEKDGRVIGIIVGENAVQTSWSYVEPITPVCQALHLA